MKLNTSSDYHSEIRETKIINGESVLHIRIILAAGILLLSACSTTTVGLKYSAVSPVTKVSAKTPPVTLGVFQDQRGVSPIWLGAIRGGFGNPLKYLEAERPVAEMVQAAFADGLNARGIAVDKSSPQYQIAGVITKLDCSQLVRREAHVYIQITVSDKTEQQRFSRLYKADNVDGSVLSMDVGLFASVEDLRVVLEKTLHDVVNQALDDSELRNVIQL